MPVIDIDYPHWKRYLYEQIAFVHNIHGWCRSSDLPPTLLSGKEEYVKDMNYFILIPDLIERYSRDNVFSQLDHHKIKISFADFFELHPTLRFLKNEAKYESVDEFISNEDVYKWCAPFLIADIMSCRWVKHRKNFSVDPLTLNINICIESRCEHQVIDFMHIFGYELISNKEINGQVYQTYEFSLIPVDVRNYKVVEQRSLNGIIYVGPEKREYKITFANQKELNRHFYLQEYDIEDTHCLTKAVYFYPDETVIYAAEVID